MGLTKRKDSYYVEFPVLDDRQDVEACNRCGWGAAEAVKVRL